MTLYDKLNKRLEAYGRKHPWRFLGFIFMLVVLSFTIPKSLVMYALIFMMAFAAFTIVLMVFDIVHRLKNPNKYATKYCDKCGHILPRD